MNKLFLSIATAAICFTGMAPQAQATPQWAAQAADDICHFRRQGYSFGEAGKMASQARSNGPYLSEALAEYENGTMVATLRTALRGRNNCTDVFN